MVMQRDMWILGLAIRVLLIAWILSVIYYA
jgi:hypothetical protein